MTPGSVKRVGMGAELTSASKYHKMEDKKVLKGQTWPQGSRLALPLQYSEVRNTSLRDVTGTIIFSLYLYISGGITKCWRKKCRKPNWSL